MIFYIKYTVLRRTNFDFLHTVSDFLITGAPKTFHLFFLPLLRVILSKFYVMMYESR